MEKAAASAITNMMNPKSKLGPGLGKKKVSGKNKIIEISCVEEDCRCY